MALTQDKQLRSLRDRAREISRTWPLNEAQFRLQTGWAKDYGGLFGGRFTRVLEEDEILKSVLGQGRAILAGRGGDGKTWLLRRLYIKLLDRGDLPILLDLKQWSGADYDEWKKWTSSEIGDAGDFLVRRFSGLQIGAVELDRLPPGTAKTLLVDGLNEIVSPVGAQLLELLDELVRDQLNLSVLVADRLTRRDLPHSARWSIGTTLPLSKDEVQRHLGSDAKIEPNGILTSPFFLDAALKYQVKGLRRSEASERFLIVHGGLKGSDLDSVAAAAFDTYRRLRARVFSRAEFAVLAGEGPTSALEQSHTIVTTSEGKSYFVHHLLHDYLAARHFARLRSEEWTPEALSIISFEASSFDAIELVFEQLGQQRADLFLRQIYDWNLYAAGYALSQERDADTSASKEMRAMILAMLSEKRFDFILATRERATDALALMQLSDAAAFREAASLEVVFSVLDGIRSNEGWFNEWRRLFQTTPQTRLSLESLASIRSPNSIIGWTVSNIAKRSTFEADAPAALAQWARGEPTSTVRWRIAHALGAYPTRTSLNTLLLLLDQDPDGYVRYGSIRSVVELATRSDNEFRSTISDAIGERAKAISGQPRVLGELRTSVLVDVAAAPPDWLSFVQKIVRDLFSATDDVKERDLWRQCLNKAETLYSNEQEGLPPNGAAPRRMYG
jgi:hypothetical protein